MEEPLSLAEVVLLAEALEGVAQLDDVTDGIRAWIVARRNELLADGERALERMIAGGR